MISSYQSAFIAFLEKHSSSNLRPSSLYAPADYILSLGGKRIRPVLALLSADAVSGNYKQALPAAMTVEVFHNFSLVHDDIMDEAPLRRGQSTVHEKWNVNTGILSGDVMLVMAYEWLNDYPPALFTNLTQLFSKTAREVCEGQQYDMDFPTQTSVSQEEYLHMITHKTAVLLGCSLQMGALVGGLSKAESQPFYDFGIQLGIAFQLQDDYLDAFGDPKTFGKQVGGDIIENKKTLLYLLALEKGDEAQRSDLLHWMGTQPTDPTRKIEAVKKLFKATLADQAIQNLMEVYTQKALKEVDKFPVPADKKALFTNFALQLMKRDL